jgi:hypothetical protein
VRGFATTSPPCIGWSLTVAAASLLLTGCSVPGDAPGPLPAPGSPTASVPPGSSSARPSRSERSTAGVPVTGTSLKHRAANRAIPSRLTVASLDIDSPIRPVGVGATGEMELPETIHEVGWYKFSARPSDGTGVTVLAAHVDTRGEGLGPFARLRDVQIGASVMLTATEGDRRAYRVTDVQRIAKTSVPLDQLFRREGPAALVLITCGGRYDQGLGYRDNVIVTAAPERL